MKKLLDRLVEDTIKRSSIIERTVNTLLALSTNVYNLSVAVIDLTKQSRIQEEAIIDLYVKNEMVLQALKSNALDPGISLSPAPTEPEKPN